MQHRFDVDVVAARREAVLVRADQEDGSALVSPRVDRDGRQPKVDEAEAPAGLRFGGAAGGVVVDLDDLVLAGGEVHEVEHDQVDAPAVEKEVVQRVKDLLAAIVPGRNGQVFVGPVLHETGELGVVHLPHLFGLHVFRVPVALVGSGGGGGGGSGDGLGRVSLFAADVASLFALALVPPPRLRGVLALAFSGRGAFAVLLRGLRRCLGLVLVGCFGTALLVVLAAVDL